MTADGGDYVKLDTCLACGGTELTPYLDLQVQPLANDFRPIPPTQTTIEWTDYPLGLQVCRDCWHSQNLVAVDPAILYTHYNYVSGTSASLRQYFGEFVDRVELDCQRLYGPNGETDVAPKTKLRVLEVACNDGTLLKMFADRGHKVRGVDPARNVAEMAWEKGVDVTVGFWDENMAGRVQETDHAELQNEYDVVVAMNVLGHTADPLAFLQLAKRVLAPGGRIYVQTSQAHMVERGEFDTVYHEHLSFFTARSFQALAKRAGLHIAQHEIADVHGGSHLVVMQAEAKPGFDYGVAVREAAEYAAGLYAIDIYELFQQRTRDRLDLVRQALGLYRAGRRVVGYGAAAKSMTFVNALIAWMDRFPRVSIAPASGEAYATVASRPRGPIDYFVDDSALKQNTLCPGSGIPVYAPDRLDGELGPILFVVGAWNMSGEIIARIKARRPGKRDLFLTYFPSIELKG